MLGNNMKLEKLSFRGCHEISDGLVNVIGKLRNIKQLDIRSTKCSFKTVSALSEKSLKNKNEKYEIFVNLWNSNEQNKVNMLHISNLIVKS